MSTPFKVHVFAEQYVLLDHIATGGMAEIYAALPLQALERKNILVIKKLLPRYANNKKFVQMLIDEAKICATLQHDNVVHIHDLGVAGQDFYISMEYVQGKSLDYIIKHLKEKRIFVPTEIVTYIYSEIAKALKYAHSATDFQGRALNLVHCDITPGNILIGYDGRVKVTDFGIATALHAGAESHLKTLGKLHYMAPEQLNDQTVDNSVDVYASSVILYELFTGQKPFFADHDVELQRLIRDEPVPRPSTLRETLNSNVDSLLCKALAKERADRFTKVDGILDVLNQISKPCSKEVFCDFLKYLFKKEQEDLQSRLATALTQASSAVRDFEDSLQNDEPSEVHFESTQFIEKRDEDLPTSFQPIDKKKQAEPKQSKPNSQQEEVVAVPEVVEIDEVEMDDCEPETTDKKEKPAQPANARVAVAKIDLVKADSLELGPPNEIENLEIKDEASDKNTQQDEPSPAIEPVEVQPAKTTKQPHHAMKPAWGIGVLGVLVCVILLSIYRPGDEKPEPVLETADLQVQVYVFSEKAENDTEQRVVQKFVSTSARGESSTSRLLQTFFTKYYREYKNDKQLRARFNVSNILSITRQSPLKSPFWDRQRMYRYFDEQLLALDKHSVEQKTSPYVVYVYFYRQKMGERRRYPLQYFGSRRKNQVLYLRQSLLRRCRLRW